MKKRGHELEKYGQGLTRQFGGRKGKEWAQEELVLSWSSGDCLAVAVKPAVINKRSASLGRIFWNVSLGQHIDAVVVERLHIKLAPRSYPDLVLVLKSRASATRTYAYVRCTTEGHREQLRPSTVWQIWNPWRGQAWPLTMMVQWRSQHSGNARTKAFATKEMTGVSRANTTYETCLSARDSREKEVGLIQPFGTQTTTRRLQVLDTEPFTSLDLGVDLTVNYIMVPPSLDTMI